MRRGKNTAQRKPANTPAATPAPEVTAAPAATQAPEVTTAAAATQAPEVTTAAAATQAPEVTTAAAATQAPEVTTAPAPAVTTAPKKVKKFPYTVADGKSITTKRGVKSPGQEIQATDLAGGEVVLKDLVKKKFVVKA